MRFSDTYSFYRKDSLVKPQINLTLTEALKVAEEYYSMLPQISETYCTIYKKDNYSVEIKNPADGYSDVTRHTDLDTIFGIIDDIATIPSTSGTNALHTSSFASPFSPNTSPIISSPSCILSLKWSRELSRAIDSF